MSSKEALVITNLALMISLSDPLSQLSILNFVPVRVDGGNRIFFKGVSD